MRSWLDMTHPDHYADVYASAVHGCVGTGDTRIPPGFCLADLRKPWCTADAALPEVSTRRTPSSEERSFWRDAREAKVEVDTWPTWKREAAGRALVTRLPLAREDGGE